jgi:hypothetical protein
MDTCATKVAPTVSRMLFILSEKQNSTCHCLKSVFRIVIRLKFEYLDVLNDVLK